MSYALSKKTAPFCFLAQLLAYWQAKNHKAIDKLLQVLRISIVSATLSEILIQIV